MISSNLLSLCLFLNIIFFYNICASENVKKSVEDNRDDDMGDDTKEESMEISAENETNNSTLCTRRKNSQIHEVQVASHNQYPFIVAIMSSRDEYVCTGSIIANGIILTTAHCAESANYVLVNTTSAKKTDSSVILRTTKTEKYPTYPGNKDVAIIYTDKVNNTDASKIKVVNITKSDSIFELEAIGFGLNAQAGQIKELQAVGLEAEQSGEVTSAFMNCIDTKVPSCFRDTGGPVIIGDELIGIIVKGEDECTSQISSTYASNKHMVDFLNTYAFKGWLEEKIDESEESLETYPTKPIVRENKRLTTSSGDRLLKKTFYALIMQYFLLSFF